MPCCKIEKDRGLKAVEKVAYGDCLWEEVRENGASIPW